MAEAAELQGTTSAPARRWLRRATALLAAVPLLAGLVHVTAPSEAAAAPKPTGSHTVDVAIDSLTPATPTGDDTLSIKGTVTNKGGTAISDAHVGLRLGSVMRGRSAIDTAATRTGYFPGADGVEIDSRYARRVGKLPAGGSQDFSLAVPLGQLALSQDGVYQIAVSLVGETPDQPAYPRVLGIQRTFLPWQTTPPGKKTKLSFLWPVVSSTQITARTKADDQQTPIFRSDDLAKELAPGGRLQQIVALGKDLPVTWVLDPDLLATVDAMTRAYEVQDGEGTTAGRGQNVARQWLATLDKTVEGHEVVALPFADPDLASLAHRGKVVSGTLGHLKPATDLASRTVESILQVKPRTDFAWPVDGAIDASIVDVATSAGAHHVIARGDSLRESDQLPYTPTAARPIGGGTTAIVADARLSTVFEGDMSRAENSTLAIQEFLAQTLMITQQTPERQRSIVVAPPRMPTANQAQAMATALGGLESRRWSEPQNLGEAARAKPDPAANRRVPGRGAYPKSLRGRELPTSAFSQIQQTQRALDRFRKALTVEERVVPPFTTAIMRDMSTSWRRDPGGARAFRDDVTDHLQKLTEQVGIIQKSPATLSGRSATIPVTVKNELVQGVDGLRLVLTSSQPLRLKVSDPQEIRIDGGHSQSVKFEASARANGRTTIVAQLFTEDGQPYGAPMTFEVNVTSITSTVILVIAVGVLLLVLAGIRIYVKRKRSGPGLADPGDKPGGTDPDSAPGPRSDPRNGPATPTETGPQAPTQPSDPSSDTGSQSTGPSGSGEKVDR
ncbi:DUF6049 family protein [Streptomyces sp. NPDC057702]|uniref:DUF6049 family protein n=1 Tax=unclassified Streptomyces TaxID=2593676 RepID=UPI003676C6D9